MLFLKKIFMFHIIVKKIKTIVNILLQIQKPINKKTSYLYNALNGILQNISKQKFCFLIKNSHNYYIKININYTKVNFSYNKKNYCQLLFCHKTQKLKIYTFKKKKTILMSFTFFINKFFLNLFVPKNANKLCFSWLIILIVGGILITKVHFCTTIVEATSVVQKTQLIHDVNSIVCDQNSLLWNYNKSSIITHYDLEYTLSTDKALAKNNFELDYNYNYIFKDWNESVGGQFSFDLHDLLHEKNQNYVQTLFFNEEVTKQNQDNIRYHITEYLKQCKKQNKIFKLSDINGILLNKNLTQLHSSLKINFAKELNNLKELNTITCANVHKHIMQPYTHWFNQLYSPEKTYYSVPSNMSFYEWNKWRNSHNRNIKDTYYFEKALKKASETTGFNTDDFWMDGKLIINYQNKFARRLLLFRKTELFIKGNKPTILPLLEKYFVKKSDCVNLYAQIIKKLF